MRDRESACWWGKWRGALSRASPPPPTPTPTKSLSCVLPPPLSTLAFLHFSLLLSLSPPSLQVLHDLGAVVGFFGALLGSAVVYVLPGLMFRAAVRRSAAAAGSSGGFAIAGEEEATVGGWDYHAAGAMVWAGAGLGLLGAAVVVLRALTDLLD